MLWKFKKNHLFFTVVIIIVLLSLWNLQLFPIFADEAIYLHWAQRISLRDVSPFVSMFDGKPPLFVWLSALLYKFIHNLLLSGRLVSVISLWGGLVILWLKLKKINSNWANISVILIALSPYVLFHSRLALMDTLLAILLLSAVVLIDNIFISGLLLGIAFWVKTPAIFLFPLPILKYFIDKAFDWQKTKKIFTKSIFAYFKNEKKELLKLAIATVIPFIILSLLKFSIWFPNLFSRSEDFTFSTSQVLGGHISQIIPNLMTLFSWLNIYLGVPILILFIYGLFRGFYQKQKILIILFISSLIFSLPFIIFGKVVASRYYLFSAISVILIATYGLVYLPKKLKYLFLLLIIFFDLNFAKKLIFKPTSLQLSVQDQGQYLGDWSSGIGIASASQKVRDFAHKNGDTLLLTEGYFGTLPDGVFVSLNNLKSSDHLEVIGVGNPSSKDFMQKVTSTNRKNIFYLGNQNRIDDRQRFFMELFAEYPKVSDKYPTLQLYKVDLEKYYQSEVYKQFFSKES